MNAPSQPYRVIGQRIPKVDAIDKVTGRSLFGADLDLPHMLKGKVLRSPHAHARIARIDTSQAEALPGVIAIITGADLPLLQPNTEGAGGHITNREYYVSHEVLARDKVLYHGQTVAAVAATSEEIAEEALDLIQVDYDILTPLMSPTEAMQPQATPLHDDLFTISAEGTAEQPSNVAEYLEMGRGDVETGFAEADVIVERTFHTQVVHQGYIEPDSEAAQVREDGSVVVWANTQTTYHQRHDLAILLDIPMSKIRVIPTEVGGAFGGKESVRVSVLCVALARKAGQPVRITLSREDVLRATGPSCATVSTVKVGAKNDGTITAIQAKLIYDAGSYPGAPLRSAIRRVYSQYHSPNLKIDAYDVVTNKPHVAAYRAPGATPTNFALESVIDEVGERLNLNPLEFRLQNVSRTNDPMPDGVKLSSVSLDIVLQRVKEHPCWTTPLTKPNQGRGLSMGLWTMPGGTTSCHINLIADGSVTLVLGTVDLSATRTSLSMIAAEALGLDFEDVRVVVGDTDMVAYSDPSAGDRITYITSKAVYQASHDLLNRLTQRAAEHLKTSPDLIEYERKVFWVRGAKEQSITLADLAHQTVQRGGAIMGYGSSNETWDTVAIAPNAAAHVADVEVDPETGQITLIGYTAFQDVGLCVNPDQVEGQLQGGATQGIGWALSETYTYNDDGVMQNANLLDYRLPTSVDVPNIGAALIEEPSDDHPYGIRAVGQVPIVPPAGAIANAVARATGIRLQELPMTPDRVFAALQKADGNETTSK